MSETLHKLQIHMFPCLEDNYGFLLHDPVSGATATVDTPDVTAILKALADRNWKLTHIFNTHHHWDHAGGNLELKQVTGCRIAGPHAEASRIPGIDIHLQEGDRIQLGNFTARIYDTPGHTSGHIIYHFESEKTAFVGDTLFAMGCGRLFEGTAEQMWNSLQKIMQWPEETELYCAHEYTLNNARFALTVDPDNQELLKRYREIEKLRNQQLPTIPTILKKEKLTNPFLRPTDVHIRKHLNMTGSSDVEVFTRIRKLKDAY